MAAEPIATSITVPDWDAVEAALPTLISTSAYHLPELNAHLDNDLHHLLIDPELRTLWHAYDNAPLDGEGWTIDQLTPDEAADMLDPYIGFIQDRLDDPQIYAEGVRGPDDDQAALDEYAAILRLSVPDDPTAAAAHIRARREQLLQLDARWQRAYTNLVRGLAGDEHGGKRRAAAVIQVSEMQVGRIIREDDKRRATLDEAVQEARRALAGDGDLHDADGKLL